MAIKTTPVQQVFSIDLRSLALFRILLGVILVLDVINRMSLIPAFYSNTGIAPIDMITPENMEHAYHFQLMMLSGGEWFSYLFMGLLVILSFFLIVGYKTRVAAFLCWLMFCSLSVRNELILHAGDTLLTLLLFWAMFLPLNKAFSVDVLQSQNLKSKGKSYFSTGTIGLYIQFVLIYIMNGLYKGMYINWIDGSHLYYTFSRFEFVKPFALFIYPYQDLLSFLTQFSLYLELFGPLLFFIPVYFLFFRMLGIVLFSGLQLSIFLTLNIGLFPVISLAGILVFIPSGFWDSLKNWNRANTQSNKNITNSFFGSGKKVVTDLFLIFVIFYVIAWNIDGYSSKIDLPESFKKPGYFLKLNQKWSLFASPAEKSRYISVQATYHDGDTSDLLKDLKTTGTVLDEMRYARYTNYRWRIFITKRVENLIYREYLPGFIDYLYKDYGEEKKWNRIDVIQHVHFIFENYNLIPLQSDILYTASSRK